MKKNTKQRIEVILKYTWLVAAIILLIQAAYYTQKVGFEPSVKFYLLSGISFLFFVRRHYFSK